MTASSPSEKAKMRILMVEDEIPIAEMACMLLRSAGFEACSAPTVSDAEHQMELVKPDALLLDINLPDENGLAFLKRFKEFHADIPVVIYTSEGFDELRMQLALENGASGYASKFMDMENVMATLRRVIKDQQAAVLSKAGQL